MTRAGKWLLRTTQIIVTGTTYGVLVGMVIGKVHPVVGIELVALCVGAAIAAEMVVTH